jgi:hypothetical protein
MCRDSGVLQYVGVLPIKNGESARARGRTVASAGSGGSGPDGGLPADADVIEYAGVSSRPGATLRDCHASSA